MSKQVWCAGGVVHGAKQHLRRPRLSLRNLAVATGGFSLDIFRNLRRQNYNWQQSIDEFSRPEVFRKLLAAPIYVKRPKPS